MRVLILNFQTSIAVQVHDQATLRASARVDTPTPAGTWHLNGAPHNGSDVAKASAIQVWDLEYVYDQSNLLASAVIYSVHYMSPASMMHSLSQHLYCGAMQTLCVLPRSRLPEVVRLVSLVYTSHKMIQSPVHQVCCNADRAISRRRSLSRRSSQTVLLVIQRSQKMAVVA